MGAAVQTHHLVVLRALGRQHDDRQLGRAGRGPELFQDAESILLRQHDIQQHQGRHLLSHGLPEQGGQRKAPGLHTLAVQCIDHKIPDTVVILQQIDHRYPSPFNLSAPLEGRRVSPSGGRSDQLLLVNHQLELQAQLLRCLSTEEHPAHEDLKIVHDRAVLRVHGQLQLDERVLLVDLQDGLLHRVVHPVMDVEAGHIRIPDPAAADVGLVRQDQCRRHGVHRHAGALVVVADGGDDGGDLLRRTIHVVQNAEGHDRTGLGVIHPVHQVADVVKKPGDLCQLHRPLRIPQGGEDIGGVFRHRRHVGKAVLRIAQSGQRLVRPLDIGPDRRIVFHILIGKHGPSPFSI
ncbi:selenide, water dikinase SelD, partial [Dysosmobacter welbionis]